MDNIENEFLENLPKDYWDIKAVKDNKVIGIIDGLSYSISIDRSLNEIFKKLEKTYTGNLNSIRFLKTIDVENIPKFDILVSHIKENKAKKDLKITKVILPPHEIKYSYYHDSFVEIRNINFVADNISIGPWKDLEENE